MIKHEQVTRFRALAWRPGLGEASVDDCIVFNNSNLYAVYYSLVIDLLYVQNQGLQRNGCFCFLFTTLEEVVDRLMVVPPLNPLMFSM